MTVTKRQPIKPNETLLLADFLERTNLGRGAWRTVRDRCEELGIVIVTYAARQAYVSTNAWLKYLQRCETTHKQTRVRRKKA